MVFLNGSDLNAEGSFYAPNAQGVKFPAKLTGYMDSVAVDEVPTYEGRNELLLLVSGESGHTQAAVRMRDLLRLAMQHHPELVAEVQRELSGTDATDDTAAPEVLTGYAAYGQRG